MPLIKCAECSRDISDQATACPGCGAPVVVRQDTARAPAAPSIDDGCIVATREMIAALAQSAIQACGYRVDASDPAAGTVTFTTGMTMGSWSGVSGTLSYREIAPYRFEVLGAAKQNVKGGQAVALDLFGEAKSKVDNVIHEMKRLAESGKVSDPQASAEAGAGTGCAIVFFAMGIAPSLWALSHFA